MMKNKIKNIADINKKYVEENEKIKEYILKEELKEILKNMNEILVEKIRLRYLKDGIAYLEVSDSTSKHFIHTNKNKILKQINLKTDFSVRELKSRVR